MPVKSLRWQNFYWRIMLLQVVKQEVLQQISFISKCPVSLQQNYLNFVCPVVCVWERESYSAGEKI